MKKSLYLLIISIVTVAAILVGLYIHVFGRGFFKMFGGGDAATEEKSIDVSGDFTDLIVDLDASDVKIEYGEKAVVEYRLPENMAPDISVENGTLQIKKKKNSGWSLSPFQMGDCYVRVIIPEGTVLGDVSVNLDAGDLLIASVETEDLSLDADAGDIKINEVNAKNAEFDVDAGNLELTGCEFGDLTMDVDAGNINLTKCTVEKINANVDAGNLESHESDISAGYAEVDLGNIALHGTIGDVQTKVSLGNVEVDK